MKLTLVASDFCILTQKGSPEEGWWGLESHRGPTVSMLPKFQHQRPLYVRLLMQSYCNRILITKKRDYSFTLFCE